MLDNPACGFDSLPPHFRLHQGKAYTDRNAKVSTAPCLVEYRMRQRKRVSSAKSLKADLGDSSRGTTCECRTRSTRRSNCAGLESLLASIGSAAENILKRMAKTAISAACRCTNAGAGRNGRRSPGDRRAKRLMDSKSSDEDHVEHPGSRLFHNRNGAINNQSCS